MRGEKKRSGDLIPEFKVDGSIWTNKTNQEPPFLQKRVAWFSFVLLLNQQLQQLLFSFHLFRGPLALTVDQFSNNYIPPLYFPRFHFDHLAQTRPRWWYGICKRFSSQRRTFRHKLLQLLEIVHRSILLLCFPQQDALLQRRSLAINLLRSNIHWTITIIITIHSNYWASTAILCPRYRGSDK